MKAEGGYKLTNIANDRGGQTYAGISRRANPDWIGWAYVDNGQTPPTEAVRTLYREKYWYPIRGQSIQDQETANHIYDFAVNAGVTTAVKLAQAVVEVEADGKIGEKTLAAINSMSPGLFSVLYTIAKLTRYQSICMKDRSQTKFLLGWLNRSLEALK